MVSCPPFGFFFFSIKIFFFLHSWFFGQPKYDQSGNPKRNPTWSFFALLTSHDFLEHRFFFPGWNSSGP